MHGSSTYWDDIGALDDDLPAGWRRHARAAHLDLFERWVGAPTGTWLKTDLAEEGRSHRALLPLPPARWIAVDLSPAVAAVAAGRCAPAVADIRRLPVRDGAVDGILSTSTLDHFDVEDDIHVSLRELRRTLRPGGTLVLTLDNRANPLVALRNRLPGGVRRASGLAPFHVGPTLDLDGGVRALEQAGFAVLDTALLLHAPHVVGTRLARLGWWERRALPAFDRLGTTRAGRRSAHFVAFHASAGPA